MLTVLSQLEIEIVSERTKFGRRIFVEMNEERKVAGIYIRVSTEDQARERI